jgi:hypothetical protein
VDGRSVKEVAARRDGRILHQLAGDGTQPLLGQLLLLLCLLFHVVGFRVAVVIVVLGFVGAWPVVSEPRHGKVVPAWPQRTSELTRSGGLHIVSVDVQTRVFSKSEHNRTRTAEHEQSLW